VPTMFGAASLTLSIGIVAAGVVVVLGAMIIASRSRGAPRPAPAPAPQPKPATRRIAGPERRDVTRAPVVRPVIVKRPAGEARTFALDVSAGGILLAGPSDLMVGELIDLQLDLDEPLTARAQVVRDAPNGMKGLRFEALGGADRDRLERFVRSAVPALA
jgi:hypothetical protein